MINHPVTGRVACPDKKRGVCVQSHLYMCANHCGVEVEVMGKYPAFFPFCGLPCKAGFELASGPSSLILRFSDKTAKEANTNA